MVVSPRDSGAAGAAARAGGAGGSCAGAGGGVTCTAMLPMRTVVLPGSLGRGHDGMTNGGSSGDGGAGGTASARRCRGAGAGGAVIGGADSVSR